MISPRQQVENVLGEIWERIANRGKAPSPEQQRAKMEALGLSEFQLAFYMRALPMLLAKLDLLPPEYVGAECRLVGREDEVDASSGRARFNPRDLTIPMHAHIPVHAYSCLAHRLRQWLSVGSDLVAPQLHRLSSTPCLVIAGTVDNLLPSYEEARRLRRELPDCQVGTVRGSAICV